MKYRIVCEIPQFEMFERLEVDTKEEFDDVVAYIAYTINNNISNYGLIDKTTTYNSTYGCPGDCTENLLGEVKEIFNSIENKNVYGERLDSEGKILERIEIYNVDDWIEGIQATEQTTIYAIDTALNVLGNFLNQGFWQEGLIDENGIIYKHINKWHHEASKNGEIRWSVDGTKTQPILWFGVKDETNEDCWTIRGHKNLQNSNEEFLDHLAIRWEFGDLNWEVFNMDYSADYIWSWIAETGIDDLEVTNKAIEVFENCPIKIMGSDDFNSIEKKLNQYFISLINKHQ